MSSLNQTRLAEAVRQLISPQQAEKLSYYLFDTIASTNQTTWELIAQGIKPPLIAIATEQTAGRGQWGRTWQSAPGGLYLSLGLKINLPVENVAHITLFTAWGIAQKLRSYQIPVQLKWPNDLVLQGRKLGGIKTENRINQGRIIYTVIGVGINWINPIPNQGINLKTWFQNNSQASRINLEDLAALTIAGIFFGYESYKQEGIESILNSYLDIFHNLGQLIFINGNSGRVIGITSQGELKVRFKSPGATTDLVLPPGTISLGYPESPNREKID